VHDEEPVTRVRLSLGWEGHEHLEFDSAALATQVERLIDVGVAAAIGSSARSEHERHEDFVRRAAQEERMKREIGPESTCSFCGASAVPVVCQDGAAICQPCVEDARGTFDNTDSSPLIRFELAYGGHEDSEECRMTLTGSQLGRVVEALTEAGIVAGVECLASDKRLRSAADFSPDPDRVVEEERVLASLGVSIDEDAMQLMVRRLGEVQVLQVRDFLGLASFHGGYTVRKAE